MARIVGAVAATETAFGVLAVGGGGRAPPEVQAQAMAAAEWWARISHGQWQPRPVMLPGVILPDDPARWCAGGGLGPGPRNAPRLVRAALLALPRPAREVCPRRVMMVVDAPIAPHAWRVAEGGVAVLPGRWVRRYAAVAASMTLGAWVHEMAHLLLDWPDLPDSPCLMGSGARRDGGKDPAPPGTRLRLAAGWMREVPATAGLLANELATDEVAVLRWGSRRIGFSRAGSAVVVDDLDDGDKPLGIVPLADGNTPILATVLAESDCFVARKRNAAKL